MPGIGARMTSSPTAPRTVAPVSSVTSAAVPMHGPEKEAGRIGPMTLPETMPPGDLRPARVVDDRAAALAHLAEVPPPRLWVPRFAGRAEDPQRRAVVRPDGVLAVGHERTDDRRRDAEMGDPVALDDRPQAVRAGEVRRALVQHEPGAAQERPGDRPGAHHPAEVGEPEEAVAGAEVEVVGEVLRGLDREAAVDMDRPLGPAGRPGRVDEHERGLGVDVARWVAPRPRSVAGPDARRDQRLVPPDVATGRPRRVDRIARPPDDEDVPHRWHGGDRRVGDALQRDPRTPRAGTRRR